jgi:S-adenosyl methyltransferase
LTHDPPSCSQERLPGVDATRAHTARVWNYWLGGKDNYSVDREVGDQVFAVLPDIVDAARAQRGFLVRAVRYLAGEAGSASFSTSASVCPLPTTPTKLPKRPPRNAALSTLTTTF